MQAQRIMETILGRYNEILSTLQTDPDSLEPIFWSEGDGAVIVEDWAMGFLDGIQLRLKQWVPLLKPGKPGVLILPIALRRPRQRPESALYSLAQIGHAGEFG
jgi:uncharacterized protein